MTCNNVAIGRKSVLLFKNGGVPAGADAFELTSVPILSASDSEATEVLDLVGNGKMNASKEVRDSENLVATLSGTLPCRALGTQAEPKYGRFLEAAGFTKSTATNKVIYTLSSSQPPSSNAIVYNDGMKSTSENGALNLTLTAGTNSVPKIGIEFTGFTDGVKTAEAAPTLTLDDNDFFRFSKSSAVTMGGSDISIDSMSVALNNDIAKEYGAGIACYHRVNYNPVLTVEAWHRKDNIDAWTHFLNEDIKEFKATFTAPNGETMEVKTTYAKARIPTIREGNAALRETRAYKLENEAAVVITFTKP